MSEGHFRADADTIAAIATAPGAGGVGVITGKALYRGAFTLRDALKREEA